MKTKRMIGLAALGAATLSAAVIPAGAEDAPTIEYASSADGAALDLVAMGTRLTIGQTHTDIASSLIANAAGDGLLIGTENAGTARAAVTGNGTADGSTDETCETAPLASVIDATPGIDLDVACGSSFVSILDGNPTAVATGKVSSINLNPMQPVLETPLGDVVGVLGTTIDALLDGLDPLTSAVDDTTGLGVSDTLDDLFDTLFEGADLVNIDLGQAETRSAVTGTNITSTCASEASRIDLLDAGPIAGIDPEPLMSVIVGKSSAAVSVDRLTGTATPEVEVALVRLIVPTLGIDEAVAPGQTLEIPLPAPLTSRIVVAAPTSGTTPEGQHFARASAVRLELLDSDTFQGGVVLALADCQAMAAANIVAPTPAPEVFTTPEAPTLPRTGGGMPGPLALGITLGLAGAGLTLLRRSDNAVG